MRAPFLVLCLAVLSHLLAVAASPAQAAWPHDPLVNLPVCTAANHQQDASVSPDGAGGAFVAWTDSRVGTSAYDIYLQHVLPSGVVDPAWPANGVAVCAVTNIQGNAIVLPDAAAINGGPPGAIVLWEDFRNGAHMDLYMQHVLASGQLDPLWPATGRALCTAGGNQSQLVAAPDGAGGFFAAWRHDGSSLNFDIYAQHILSTGDRASGWPVNGRAVCTASGHQSEPSIVVPGAGAAIVAWEDSRSDSTSVDIYAQRMIAAGTVDPEWPVNGVPVCTESHAQFVPRLAPDGGGGAIVVWQDQRSTFGYAVVGQNVLASGVVNPAWPADGLVLAPSSLSQEKPALVADGGGGAIVAWESPRAGTGRDLFAQHVIGNGVVNPTWPAAGLVFCEAPGNQEQIVMLRDGAGGVVATWSDPRGGGTNYDIYAHRLLASGVTDAYWPTNGLAVSTAPGNQLAPAIALDGIGGVVVAWLDFRGGTSTDLYMQRIGQHGRLGTPEPELVSVEDIPGDQGGMVRLSWNASYLDLSADPDLDLYDVLRAVIPSEDAPARSQGALVAGANFNWDILATLPAQRGPSVYTYDVPTHADATPSATPMSVYMVTGRNSAGTRLWPSRPDSGFSVDDLAPAMPSSFLGTYESGTALLHWEPNGEADLGGYRLYRGPNPGFTPEPGNLLAALPDTGYVDAAGEAWVYKLTAVDIHGNESPAATFFPSEVLAVGDAPVARAFLELAGANPTRSGAALRFGLVTAGRASLALYDAAGRRVRTLAGGDFAAGEHAIAWDGRDEAGRPAPAGLYFARLEAPGFAATRRIVRAD